MIPVACSTCKLKRKTLKGNDLFQLGLMAGECHGWILPPESSAVKLIEIFNVKKRGRDFTASDDIYCCDQRRRQWFTILVMWLPVAVVGDYRNCGYDCGDRAQNKDESCLSRRYRN